jgi:hypothetical protein
VELSVVQILFVVAITVMKTNRNEVEKGFLQRSFRQELVGIKENWQTQSSKGHISKTCDSFPKMKQVKIPAHELDAAQCINNSVVSHQHQRTG